MGWWLAGWGTVALTWLALQGSALIFLDGSWRMAALIPAGAIALAVAVGVLGGLSGANMAPMWVFIALPLCILWLIGLWAIRGIAAFVST